LDEEVEIAHTDLTEFFFWFRHEIGHYKAAKMVGFEVTRLVLVAPPPIAKILSLKYPEFIPGDSNHLDVQIRLPDPLLLPKLLIVNLGGVIYPILEIIVRSLERKTPKQFGFGRTEWIRCGGQALLIQLKLGFPMFWCEVRDAINDWKRRRFFM